MKKLVLIILLMTQFGFSQVGINTTTPQAQLDIKSSNQVTPSNTDGILIPKIDAFPLTNPTAAQLGMMVYLTTISAGKQPGFYYWDGVWKGIGGAMPNGTAVGNTMYWNGTAWVNNSSFLFNNGTAIGVNTVVPSSVMTVRQTGIGFTQEDATGNSKIGFYTTNGDAWLQTHSNADLKFATNNGATQMVLKTTTGNLGINTLTPSEKLEVAGKTKTDNLQVVTGAGIGKILTSDAVGNATWQNTATVLGNLAWNTAGNTGTNSATNFIGTTDNVDLIFKRFSTRAGILNVSNTSFGVNALNPVVTGVNNTAFGANSLFSAAAGRFNTAVGTSALYSNTGGEYNTASGFNSLWFNTLGHQNVGYGVQSLFKNVDGDYNTATGTNSLYENQNGNNNTATGHSALYNNKGSDNTAVGFNSLVSNTTGASNTAIGINSLYANQIGSDNVAVGRHSLFNSKVSGNVGIGVETLFSNNSGLYNTASGSYALRGNINGSYNSAFGYNALHDNNDGTNSGSLNTAIGVNSLYNNTLGGENVGVGVSSLYLTTTGSRNVAIGNSSLGNNKTGSYSIAVGNYSSVGNIDGYNNVAIGDYALKKSAHGFFNVAIGLNALSENDQSENNTAIGYQSMTAGATGTTNTAVGAWSAYNAPGFTNSSCLGYNSTFTASNQIRIGNGGVASIGGFQNWTNVSDQRFKKDISYNTVVGLDFIKKLKPVTYHLDNDAINRFLKTPEELKNKEGQKNNILQTGFIAQEVEQAAKELNYDFSGVDKPKNENDYYGLRYAEFVVPLVKAVQEQQEIIEIQNTKIRLLEERLKKLEEK